MGRRSGEIARSRYVTWAIWLWMALFVVYPLARLLLMVFNSQSGLTWSFLYSTLKDADNLRAFQNSIFLAFSVGITGTVVGYVYAYSVEKMDVSRPVKWIVSAITVLPFVSPPFTSSIALSLVLGPGGTILKLLGIPDLIIYGYPGTLLAETLTYFPIAFLTISTVMSNIGSDLEEASLSMGASRWQTFRNITMPLSTPGIMNSFLLLFAASLADFATPMVMAGRSFPVLTTQIYLQITGMYDLRGGSAISLMLIAPALLIYLLQRRYMQDKSYVTISGRERKQVSRTSYLASIPIMSFITGLSLFILFLYGIIGAASFVKVWGVDNSLTLENYHFVFTAGINSIKDSLIIASISTIVGTILAITIAVMSSSKRNWGSSALEFISMVNYVIPGTVLGVAYLVAFNSGPIVLSGTLILIVALCATRYDTPGIRSIIAALKQIDPHLEEAANSLGASQIGVLRTITIPLTAGAIKSGMKYLFVVSMTAVSAVIFLISVDWSLLTVRILNSITELMFAQAAAFSVVLVIMVFIVIGAIELSFSFLYKK